MDVPLKNKPNKQISIRSFFQPRSNPPSSPTTQQPEREEEPDKCEEEPNKCEEEFEKGEHSLISPKSPASNTETNDRAESRSLNLPRASISAIEAHHIRPLKRINTLLLPITYPDNFYNKILSPDIPLNLSYVILWNSPRPSNPTSSKVYTLHKEQQVVGGIVCRLEQYPDQNTSSVYIQSLALLSPYRSQGLAAALLDTVIKTIVQLSPSTIPAPSSLYAHVWTENTEALAWYKTRGFIADPAPIHNYYSRLRPGTAYLLRRPINTSDYLRHKSSTNTATTASKRSSDDWEMVESPNTLSKPASAPASLPFVAPPPTTPSEPPIQKSNKKMAVPAQTYLNFPPAPTPAPNTPPTSASSQSRYLPNRQSSGQSRPDTLTHTASFQNRAPDREWNDLPLDILNTSTKNPLSRTSSAIETGPGNGTSATSSRSSSSSRPTTGKKKRSYPAAAFGST